MHNGEVQLSVWTLMYETTKR